MKLPVGAASIEATRRQRGLVPAGPVIISMVGRLPWWPDTAVVVADPNQSYRWDWLRGLEAHVWVRSGISAGPALMAILRAHPQFTWRRYADDKAPAGGLMLWDVDKRQGAYCEHAWPEAFHEDLGNLAIAGNWNAFKTVMARRFEHPRLSIRAANLDDQLNRKYVASLAWMESVK